MSLQYDYYVLDRSHLRTSPRYPSQSKYCWVKMNEYESLVSKWYEYSFKEMSILTWCEWVYFGECVGDFVGVHGNDFLGDFQVLGLSEQDRALFNLTSTVSVHYMMHYLDKLTVWFLEGAWHYHIALVTRTWQAFLSAPSFYPCHRQEWLAFWTHIAVYMNYCSKFSYCT